MTLNLDDDTPVYSIGVAAKILNLHPRTLRIYEEEKLITLERQGGKRLFSKNDLTWIQCIRKLIHDENLSIPGIKRLLEVMPCWKIKNCCPDTRFSCQVLRQKQKKCWEFVQKSCEKSCRNCDVYLEESKDT